MCAASAADGAVARAAAAAAAAAVGAGSGQRGGQQSRAEGTRAVFTIDCRCQAPGLPTRLTRLSGRQALAPLLRYLHAIAAYPEDGHPKRGRLHGVPRGRTCGRPDASWAEAGLREAAQRRPLHCAARLRQRSPATAPCPKQLRQSRRVSPAANHARPLLPRCLPRALIGRLPPIFEKSPTDSCRNFPISREATATALGRRPRQLYPPARGGHRGTFGLAPVRACFMALSSTSFSRLPPRLIVVLPVAAGGGDPPGTPPFPIDLCPLRDGFERLAASRLRLPGSASLWPRSQIPRPRPRPRPRPPPAARRARACACFLQNLPPGMRMALQ